MTTIETLKTELNTLNTELAEIQSNRTALQVAYRDLETLIDVYDKYDGVPKLEEEYEDGVLVDTNQGDIDVYNSRDTIVTTYLTMIGTTTLQAFHTFLDYYASGTPLDNLLNDSYQPAIKYYNGLLADKQAELKNKKQEIVMFLAEQEGIEL